MRILLRPTLALLASVMVSGCLTTNNRVLSADRSGESALQLGAELPAVLWQEHVVGDTARTGSGNSVTVYEVVSKFRSPGGGRFALAAADVEACARASVPRGVNVTPSYFLMQVGRTTRAPVDSAGVKEPLLPSALVKPGACKRGWIVFQLADGDRPAAVLFAASSFIRWKIAGTRGSASR